MHLSRTQKRDNRRPQNLSGLQSLPRTRSYFNVQAMYDRQTLLVTRSYFNVQAMTDELSSAHDPTLMSIENIENDLAII